MRYRLVIEYDGAAFCGWQSQADGGAVQDALQQAIGSFCGEVVTAYGAGRTDSGVHARGQVAHIDLETAPAPDRVRDGLNFHLRPAPVAVITAHYARADFDARFSALARRYRYRIISQRAPVVLDRMQAWWVPQSLDIEAMRAASKYLLGNHDFTTFRASQCQANSPIRTLDALDVSAGDAGIDITARARSFLHSQVRSMAGALKLVGQGKWQPEDLRHALEAADRRACAPVAPAHGLTFMAVDYPDEMLVSPEIDKDQEK
ncbi:MAG: tRNA pseudouridine(38-40) synthase TruA [Rhizobiales bacterium TMED143]|nr:tRNA pseudouridine(38-40) synthase TruA [Rhodobiaceae bacterium]MBL6786442.1 tRNA pseudouridine(38-40) synthase TruA [PS1 clade bacterium]OUV92895.1 MAG: tRNA pseudouridine(38-40) synthase TruA [Rhizobiales bacterium TMED143]CAI8298164.1 MAG: tRNA pseudouridine synthase A [Rhodobiaceae bacterium UBA7378]HCQ81778.1 tRNA pseudouridine(38-40) synthase TruA [Rhodobiaceae bacterium]